ncbi:MAG: hypothetical protein WDN67_04510 [Candidatus Moraniibacteriota bacterium]
MYWIYLAIFILAILTPEIITGDSFLLREGDMEALLIFCFGALGFLIYIAKEKALLRLFKEKVLLQKQTNLISRDLSQSYSYIGEVNRRFEIIRDLCLRLPEEELYREHLPPETVYEPILDAVKTLARTDKAALCFVDTRSGQKVLSVETFSPKEAGVLSKESLLGTEKSFWEEEGFLVVRSSEPAEGIHAFLMFAKEANDLEDRDAFSILVAQALLIYTMRQHR